METRKMLQWVLLGIGITAIVGYSFFVLQGFVRGPRIILTSPENGFATTSALIAVSGNTVHTNVLTLNDAPIPLDLKGNFSEHILLGLGYNILSLKAEDRYKRITERKLEIILLPSATTTIATTTPSVGTESEISTTTREVINN